MAHELEFTAASFMRISTLEARRGRDDPGQMFTSVSTVIDELKNVHKRRREASAKQSNHAKARAVYGSFRPRIAELQREKRRVMNAELQRVSQDLSTMMQDGTFSWSLGQGPVRKTRQTFQIGSGPLYYFPMKQLEINVRRSHRVTAPNRNRLVSQLCGSLEGKLPRYVFRTDVDSFYASIPHAGLLRVLSEHGGLSRTSLSLIRLLLDEWKFLTGSDVGLPTGVGLSSYLSEVYARQIDQVFTGDPAVHFYGRYVDDILVVARTSQDRDKIEERLTRRVSELGLVLSTGKTQEHSPANFNGAARKDPFDIAGPIDFLGYGISKRGGEAFVEMSSKTIDRYKLRLKSSFERWDAVSHPTSGHNGLLLNRVRFLAGNTKLVNSKGRAVTGIYFNYPQLSPGGTSLADLDEELCQLVRAYAKKMDRTLVARLKGISFVQGHVDRRYHRFRQSDLKRLVAVWRE